MRSRMSSDRAGAAAAQRAIECAMSARCRLTGQPVPSFGSGQRDSNAIDHTKSVWMWPAKYGSSLFKRVRVTGR